MDTNLVKLPPDLCKRCWGFGNAVVDRFNRGQKPESMYYATHGFDKNVGGWAQSKMAECAFALWATVNPDELNWSDEADRGRRGGGDLTVGRAKVQVKHTAMTSRLLMWPANKIGRFDKEEFHILVLVKGAEPEFLIKGWVGKEFFRRRHKVSDGAKVTVGNWIMDEDDLHRMGVFPGRSDDEREHYCWCGEWGSFGHGVSLRHGKPGAWFCREHKV